MYWCAEIVGTAFALRRRFSVSIGCGMSLSHSHIGKLSSTPGQVSAVVVWWYQLYCAILFDLVFEVD